jgi:hypothetical protein
VLGAVFALVSGAVPDPRLPDDDADEAPDAIAEATEGWGIDGDGFYVWDEDRRAAEEWAIELAGPAFPQKS